MRTSQAVKAAALAAPALLLSASVQAASDSCISLQGSSMCPSFQNNFVKPSNLSGEFNFFETVTDVASFDTLFHYYLTSQNGYYTDKIQNGLSCNTTLATNVTVQWQQTVFCSQFSEASFESGCTAETPPTLVCQETCNQFAASEEDIVDNTAYCRSTDELSTFQRSVRSDTLSNDYYTCTDYSSLATTNVNSCATGIQNEGSCGFGYSIDQLCAFCDPAGGVTPPPCCTESRTNLSQCAQWGHPLAASITPTTTVATGVPGATQTASGSAGENSATVTGTAGASATGTGAGASSRTNSGAGASNTSGSGSGNNSGSSSGANSAADGQQLVSADDKVFSTGELAGILAGVIVGALILGALLALLCLRRRGDKGDTEKNTVYGAAAANNGSHVERPWIQSEEAMVKSPELGRPSTDAKFGGPAAIGSLAAAGGAAGVGAAAAAKGRDSAEERPNSAMSGETGTDGRGTTIPAVKDQYSSHDICPGETVVAIYPYNATLNDEITLQPDDVVTVQRLYDDGWALGRTEAGGEGAFPLVCVTSTKGGTSGSGENLSGANDLTSSAGHAVTAEESA
ncbi:Src homology-3 domain protein [Kalmanozyma brasiliensis GHG001]|uniref:SH3 domain-containing protein n=1 Tax=Kalmanozyma brasiliensis (strain GHG001) TaxID=1365824 RepID=V5GHX3_KALBG|nr:Src homology-3 domain protein [Kalmanozyma brasiliensis GHG001]EST05552.1 Src homology-3 domain protein [Kalmanozyma brasiliensis GHG001]